MPLAAGHVLAVQPAGGARHGGRDHVRRAVQAQRAADREGHRAAALVHRVGAPLEIHVALVSTNGRVKVKRFLFN